jgi:hypothetical protein
MKRSQNSKLLTQRKSFNRKWLSISGWQRSPCASTHPHVTKPSAAQRESRARAALESRREQHADQPACLRSPALAVHSWHVDVAKFRVTPFLTDGSSLPHTECRRSSKPISVKQIREAFKDAEQTCLSIASVLRPLLKAVEGAPARTVSSLAAGCRMTLALVGGSKAIRPLALTAPRLSRPASAAMRKRSPCVLAIVARE